MEKHRTVEVADCFQKHDFPARAMERCPIAHANKIILKKIDQRDSYFEFICEYLMRRNNPAFDKTWAEMDTWAKRLIDEEAE